VEESDDSVEEDVEEEVLVDPEDESYEDRSSVSYSFELLEVNVESPWRLISLIAAECFTDECWLDLDYVG
jgi:hypothetical protein